MPRRLDTRNIDELLPQAKATDSEAVRADDGWLDLMQSSERALRAYVRKVTPNADEASDILSEVRLRAWLRRHALLASPDVHDAVMHCARDVCREWVATQRHDCALADSVRRAADCDCGDASSVSVQEALQWISWANRVLERLTPNQRIAVDFHYRWGWPYSVIAGMIGASECTARVHASRGLANLRNITQSEPPPVVEALNERV